MIDPLYPRYIYKVNLRWCEAHEALGGLVLAQQHTRNQGPSSGVDGGDVLVLQAIAQACLRDTKLTGEANVANESLEMDPVFHRRLPCLYLCWWQGIPQFAWVRSFI